MKDIAIYGAGGLGREIVALIERINQESLEWNLIGFFDDGKTVGDRVGNFGNVLGGIEEVNQWQSPLSVVLAMGTPQTVSVVRNKIVNPNIDFPNLIHPNFYISDKSTFSIGEGNIIQGGCVVTTSVTIGNFNRLNGTVTIGHDAVVGNYNMLMPGCRISGEVVMGNRNLIGSMAFIKQCLKVGDDVTVSPLSALLSKPKSGQTYIGNPAKIFKF